MAQQYCNHPIYCEGSILHTVQMNRIFKDSKEFVDMPLKFSVNEVLQNWTKINQTNVSQVQQFVEQNFFAAGSDCEQVIPNDWQENPEFLKQISDSKLRQWAFEVNAIWRTLSKRFIKSELRSSIIECPYPFIIAGGRFREFYNWDSLWITEGLVLSDMEQSATHMLQNFANLIERFGYVPNGARQYYIGRSQPPVTAQMADLIYKKLIEKGQEKDAIQMVKGVYYQLKMEYQFFCQQRSVHAQDYFDTEYKYVLLFHYDGLPYPRAESYREDVELANQSQRDSSQLYVNLRAACESGWDFSSRWFSDPYNIETIRTTDILPLDLNVFITLNEYILSKFANLLGLQLESLDWERMANERSKVLLDNFYNPLTNQWNDYILSQRMLNKNYYPSNFMPLLLMKKEDPRYNKIIQQIKNLIDQFPGGIPQSLFDNNQQWDFPNSWAPFNGLIIKALLKHNERKIALELAQKWIQNNYCSYYNVIKQYGEGYMFEKYSSIDVGHHGGGGEYEVQKGFGWTNGVAISLLKEFGQELIVNYICDDTQ